MSEKNDTLQRARASTPEGLTDEEKRQIAKIKPLPKQNPYIEIVTKRRIRRSTIRGKVTRYEKISWPIYSVKNRVYASK